MWHADRLPVEFTAASLALLCAVMLIRLPLVRETATDRQINQFVLGATISALLREPAIAQAIAPIIPGGTLVIFDIWHFSFLLTCVVCLSLFFFRDGRPIRQARRLYHYWLIAGCTIGVSFFFLSHSARQKGLLLPDALGWQYAAYFGLYCSVPIVGCLYALWHLLSLRTHVTNWQERNAVWIMFVVAVGGAITMGTLAAGALVATLGVDNGFTQEIEIRAGGELILPFMALAFVMLIPSSIRALSALFRIDEVSQGVRALRPMWLDLAATATPEKILRESWTTRVFAKPRIRNHRLRVEIHDAIGTVSRFAAPVSDQLDDLIETRVPEHQQEDVYLAAELILAARYLNSAGGVKSAGEPRYGAREVVDIDALVQVWELARSLVNVAETPTTAARAG